MLSTVRSPTIMFAQYVARLESEVGVSDQSGCAPARWPAATCLTITETPVPSTACRSSREATAFAKRYARGEPQVVWTTLVADLETPVSALPQARRRPADELPARIGRGRRGARALFHHRARSRPGLARTAQRRNQPHRAHRSRPLRTVQRAAARRAAHRPKAASNCPTRCRRWRPACSAISATTWCG